MNRLEPLRIPRCLLDPVACLPPPDRDGLATVQIEHAEGRITALHPVELPPSRQLPLVLTPPVDPHVHLDKAFSGASFPNPSGTMAGALEANLRELGERCGEQVLQRAGMALERAWRHGLRALRSHVDSQAPAALEVWEALQQLRARWAGRVDLQLVALAPLGYWRTAAGDLLARRVARDGGLLGSVVGTPYSPLAWDAVGSEFGSRHLQYEMFYSGAPFVTRGNSYRFHDWSGPKAMVDGMLASYDLPRAGARKAAE